MSITYSFTDNVSYGTEDINSIAKDLTGAGVAPFPTQDTYSTSDLNTLTEALVSSGVGMEGCLCQKTDNVVTVSQGIIFFENGVRMNVDSEGYVLIITENTAGYIYAYFNASLQSGGIKFSAELPETDYYVLLAKISADGVLTDIRSFARSKIATFGRNAVFETALTILEKPVIESAEVNWYTVVTRKLENIDISKFNYAFIEHGGREGIFDLNTGIFRVVYYPTDQSGNWGDAAFNTNMLVNVGGSNYYMYIYKQDDTLVLKQEGRYTWDQHQGSPVNVTLI